MAILDHSLPLQVKAPDMMGMLDQGSQIAQFYTQNKTDGELNRLYKEANGDLNKMMEIGRTSPMARFVMPQLQAQQAAQQKAALDQQKIEADIGKTWSETGQNNATTQGKNLANAQTLLTAANQALYVATQSGDANAVKLALNNAKTAGLLDDATYNQYFATAEGLSTNPEGLKNFALNLQKAYAQNPEKYNFTTADNELDNQTAIGNNIRSTNVQKYGIDKTAETADENRAVQMQRLEFDQQQAYFQKNKPVGFGVDVNGRKYAIMPDGNSRYIKDENGNYVIEQVKGGSGSGLTEQQSKDALFGARMQEAHKILTALETKDIKAPVINSVIPFGIGAKISNALPSVMGGASAEQQQYVQAQRDFINAVLRKESGAVIADSEFENAQKQYFPQIGDSDEVIAQKAKNRELAMRMIVNGSGVQGQALINSTTNSQNQLQPGQVPSAGAGGSALSFYK